VAELLADIESSGMRWGVVTNKAARFTIPVMNGLGLLYRAASVVSSDSAPEPKPAAAPLLLACAIAGASLDLLVRNDVRAQVAGLEAGLTAGLEPARGLASVGDVRVRGGVGVIQLREPVRGRELAAYAIERGVWVRPFRDLVYTMPPFVTSAEDLATVTAALVGAVAAVHG
jgi:hypothetical protein